MEIPFTKDSILGIMVVIMFCILALYITIRFCIRNGRLFLEELQHKIDVSNLNSVYIKHDNSFALYLQFCSLKSYMTGVITSIGIDKNNKPFRVSGWFGFRDLVLDISIIQIMIVIASYILFSLVKEFIFPNNTLLNIVLLFHLVGIIYLSFFNTIMLLLSVFYNLLMDIKIQITNKVIFRLTKWYVFSEILMLIYIYILISIFLWAVYSYVELKI